jgi:hypothetical protein
LGVGTGSRAEHDAGQLPAVDYEQLIGAVRETVHRVVPLNATVLVVSRGDEELLELGPRRALHFPQDEDGKYAGYHPADSDDAIAMLEKLRDYFVLPATSSWWLDYYVAFKSYLEHRYQVVASGDDCWIAQLSESPAVGADKPPMEQPAGSQIGQPIAEILGSLLPEDAHVAILAQAREDFPELAGYQVWLVGRDSQDDQAAAIASVERLAANEVRFVVVPATVFEWLEDHPAAGRRLHVLYHRLMRQEHFCEIYELRLSKTGGTLETAVAAQDRNGIEHTNGSRRSFGEALRHAISRVRGHDQRR